MTPFQEFRLWVRRAPAGERGAASVAALVVLALLVWVLIPGSGGSAASASGFAPVPGATSSTSGTAAGSGIPGTGTGTGTGSGGGTGTGTGTGTGSGSGTGTGTSTGNSGTGSTGSGKSAKTGTSQGSSNTSTPTPTASAVSCPNSSGSVNGVTSSQITIAAVLASLGGGGLNPVFGVPSTSQQKAYFTSAINSINKNGGICRRKLVPHFFTADPSSASNMTSTCLDIVQAKVFAVADAGAYAQFPQVDCFGQHKTPYFGSYILNQKQMNAYQPYLFEFNSFDTLYHDTVVALAARGFFSASHGFKKLGIPYRDCYPELLQEEISWLNQAGVPSSKIVTSDVGCPATFASPSSLEAAIEKFKTQGVTNVTTVDFVGDWSNFTNDAQAQHFDPKYGLSDDALIAVAYGSQAANSKNIANALVVTDSRDGEETTPGFKPTAGTAACGKALGKNPYTQAANAGDICDELWMLVAATDHAPVLQQNALKVGLQKAGSIDFSYPQGPNDFSSGQVSWGGQYYRVDQFKTSCKAHSGGCYEIVQSGFKRGYN